MTINELKRVVQIKQQIAKLESELARLTKTAPTKKPAKRKRKISAAGVARIKAAQKARWAAIKDQAAKEVKAVKKKFKMSASAKAKISRAAKARWAKIKAAAKNK